MSYLQALEELEEKRKAEKEELETLRTRVKELEAQLCVPTQKPISEQLTADIHRVTAVICEDTGLPPTFLASRDRSAHIVIYRQLAHYILHHIALHSYASIGAALGHDHKAVIHSVKAIEARCDTEPTIAAKTKRLSKAFSMRCLRSAAESA